MSASDDWLRGSGRGRCRALAAAERCCCGWRRSCCRSLLWCRGQLRAVRLAPAGPRHRPGRASPTSQPGMLVERAAFAAENAEVARRSGAARRRRAAPTRSSCRRRTQVARALVHRRSRRRRARPTSRGCTRACGTASRSSSGASCCRRSSACRWASCAARCPVLAADRAVHRVLPLHAGAGVRRAGGRGAGHRRRAQGRDHLHRHLLPAGAGRRQHHAPARLPRCSRRRRRWAPTPRS